MTKSLRKIYLKEERFIWLMVSGVVVHGHFALLLWPEMRPNIMVRNKDAHIMVDKKEQGERLVGTGYKSISFNGIPPRPSPSNYTSHPEASTSSQ